MQNSFTGHLNTEHLCLSGAELYLDNVLISSYFTRSCLTNMYKTVMFKEAGTYGKYEGIMTDRSCKPAF